MSNEAEDGTPRHTRKRRPSRQLEMCHWSRY